jgi:uncharacterized membrane protein
MDKNRLEAFSDGVIAIIITIMVLELKVPHNPTWQSYLDAYPVFVSYALSFVFVGLYWSTHHHLFQTVTRVDNKVLWLNMLTLFWLSLIPFATASMGENSFARVPVTVYAIILILVPASNILLINALCRLHGPHSDLYKKYKGDKKSYVTLSLNVISAIVAFVGFPKVAFVLITLTALMWFLPNYDISRNGKQIKKTR